jgi:hypothetical protein
MRSPLRFTPPEGLVAGVRSLLAHVAKHLFTDASGETYAIGRLLGVALIVWGLGAPTVVAVYYLVWGEPRPILGDWIAFVDAMVLYLPSLTAAVVGLITLTIPAERTEGDRRKRERIKSRAREDVDDDDAGTETPLG